MIKRRKLLVALGAGALAAPFSSFAQQNGKVWRIGFLSPRSRPVSFEADIYGAFLRGMRELGYVEGKNLIVEWRFANLDYERLPELTVELLKLRVDAIVAIGTPAIGAAQKANATTPIVMANATDPLGNGFASSLTRPGGNITGLVNFNGDVTFKHLEMLLSIVPRLARVAVPINPANSVHPAVIGKLQAAAQKFNVQILPVETRGPQEIDKAFFTATRNNAGAMIVLPDGLFNQQRGQIAELAVKNRLPSIAEIREYVEAGGLMSYGADLADNYRHIAIYVDRIFRGSRPGDLPIGEPTKFELFINGKTAKVLGLSIPQSILKRADKVIE